MILYIYHNCYQPVGKIKIKQPIIGRKEKRKLNDVICRIAAYSGAYAKLFNYKIVVFNVVQEKEPLYA